MQEPPGIAVPDLELFHEEADQEHYLTVMTNAWRASRTPSPAHSTQALLQVSTQNLLQTQAPSPTHSTHNLLQPGYPFYRQESSARTSCGFVTGEGDGAPLTEGFNMREPSPVVEPLTSHITSSPVGCTRDTSPSLEVVDTCPPLEAVDTSPPLEAVDTSSNLPPIEADEPSINNTGDENSAFHEVVVSEVDVPLQDVVPVADKVVVVACHSAKAASLARTCRWGGYKKV
ncbi:unnamed protein product, partial [Meganyctiphanes norvegica]